MVLKCVLRKNNSKPFCSKYFTNHFVEITSDFQEFYKPFCKAQSSLKLWVSIFKKKTTNHFVDLFVVFRKESKPFCKANPNLWSNPKICCKPFCSVPSKKCVFHFFSEKETKPFCKVIQDINQSAKKNTKKKQNHSVSPNLLANFVLICFSK